MISIAMPIVLLLCGMILIFISDIKGVSQLFQLGFSLISAGLFISAYSWFSGKEREFKLGLPKKGLAYRVVKIYDKDPEQRVALFEIIRPFWASAFFGPWVVKNIPEEYMEEGKIIDFLILSRLR